MNDKYGDTPSVKTSVRIPRKLHEQLIKAAEDNGLNLSNYLKLIAARDLAANRPTAS